MLAHSLWLRGFDTGVAWPAFRDELSLRLVALRADVHSAEPHVPAPIAERFRTIEWDTAVGQSAIPRAADVFDLLAEKHGPFPLSDGIGALSDASDLVGTACGPALYGAESP